jgi:hypothetical protein
MRPDDPTSSADQRIDAQPAQQPELDGVVDQVVCNDTVTADVLVSQDMQRLRVSFL